MLVLIPELSTGVLIGAGRVALIVEYDGAAYSGWQKQQPGVSSVEACLERAASKVANEPLALTCAGRTDAGVHGCYQVVHFDTRVVRSLRAWVLGINTELPGDIRVHWAGQMPGHFSARYSACYRRYRYVILNQSVQPGLMRNQVTWIHHALNAERMHESAQCLVGEQDFSSFRAAGCQSNTPWRNIHHINVIRCGSHVMIDIRANAFLHHMVRNIAGTLMAVGRGEQGVDWVGHVLQQRDRKSGGVTAPASGLYLVDVGYPDEFVLPKAAPGPAWLSHWPSVGDQA